MGMLDGLIQQLETSPIVQNAMKEFLSVKAILVATVNRFDQRFGVLDSKADRIIFLLEHPHQGAPAGDDGLMKVLEASGEQMIVRDDFKPIPVVHETEVSDATQYLGHTIEDGSVAEHFKQQIHNAVTTPSDTGR